MRFYAASCEATLTITMTSGRTGHWTKMRRSLAPFSGLESSVRARSLADFIPLSLGLGFRYTQAARANLEGRVIDPPVSAGTENLISVD
jgi:hypothetical protein